MKFNILCLCQNCHALLKHGGGNLKGIFEVAERVLNHEIAPEEVDERGGDFYIIDIVVVGKEKKLFYPSEHMEKLSAFFERSFKKETAKS